MHQNYLLKMCQIYFSQRMTLPLTKYDTWDSFRKGFENLENKSRIILQLETKVQWSKGGSKIWI